MSLVRFAWCAVAAGLVGCSGQLVGWTLPDSGCEGRACDGSGGGGGGGGIGDSGTDAGCDGGACRCAPGTRYCRDQCITQSSCCESIDCTPDSNPCTDDLCDGTGACGHPFNASSCDDGMACTTNDRCSLGTCQGTASCGAPPGECYQVGSCLADGGCAFVPKTSSAGCTYDGNPCTDDSCDGSGACVHPAKAGNPACDDGQACTVSDVCSGGVCAGTVSCASPPTECYLATGACAADGGCSYPPQLSTAACTADGDVCTDDHCDGAGSCVHTDNAAGCNDGDPCTTGDVCSGGACSGTPITCSGGKMCVSGACQCTGGTMWCSGSCAAPATACTDLSCGLCGQNALCDGAVVHDPVTGYDTTCADSLGGCDAGNAMSSNAADQQRYFQGANYTCTRFNGAYGWQVRVRSLTQGGPGCLSRYAGCTYLCSEAMSLALFCNPGTGDWDTNLAGAPDAGCATLYPTLPAGYACP